MLVQKLKDKLEAVECTVVDVSGGCGSAFEVGHNHRGSMQRGQSTALALIRGRALTRERLAAA